MTLKNNPDLYLFNPTCEYAIGNGSPNWQPNRLLQKMESDLSILPMFFASSGDSVLVDSVPSLPYLENLQKLGVQIPDYILKEEAFRNPDFASENWNSVKPWGWSPAAHKLLAPFKKLSSEGFKKSPIFNWQAEYRELYSKKFGLSILHHLLDEFPNESFIDKEQTAIICNHKEDFDIQIKKWERIMVKAPWSSSGRGLQPVTKTPVHPKVWEKLLGIIKEQGYAMAEPLLNKKLDIAFQFKVENKKILFVGISNFTADLNGRYLGNHLNGLPDAIDPKILSFAQFVPSIVVEPLIHVLETSEIVHKFEGYFGVDALIYEDQNGNLKINPCLEINLRYNMGLLSIQLERFLVPEIKGVYKTWYQPGKMYNDFKNEMELKHPIKIKSQRLESGFLSLTDPLPDSLFGSYILI